MVERRLTGMIAAAAVLIVLFLFWDAFRPKPRARDAAEPVTVSPEPAAPPAFPPPAQPQPAAPTTITQG
ncbi:MAG: hypothetical protein ACREMI_14060, partial [Gemmatimonadales bacterium]